MPAALSLSDIDNFGRRYSKYGDDHADDGDYYFGFAANKDFGDWGKLSMDTSYRRRDVYGNFIGGNGGWNPFIRSYIETYGFTPKYILDRTIFGCDNMFIAGIDVYRYDYSYDTYNISDVLQDYTDINKITSGIYFQNEFSIFERLKLIGGYRKETARYHFDYHDNSGSNPDVDTESKPHQKAYNFGLVYRYADESSVFFSIPVEVFVFPLLTSILRGVHLI